MKKSSTPRKMDYVKFAPSALAAKVSRSRTACNSNGKGMVRSASLSANASKILESANDQSEGLVMKPKVSHSLNDKRTLSLDRRQSLMGKPPRKCSANVDPSKDTTNGLLEYKGDRRKSNSSRQPTDDRRVVHVKKSFAVNKMGLKNDKQTGGMDKKKGNFDAW